MGAEWSGAEGGCVCVCGGSGRQADTQTHTQEGRQDEVSSYSAIWIGRSEASLSVRLAQWFPPFSGAESAGKFPKAFTVQPDHSTQTRAKHWAQWGRGPGLCYL